MTSHSTDSVALLNYESLILDELLDDDTLCILSSGLGWHKILAALIRLHASPSPPPPPPHSSSASTSTSTCSWALTDQLARRSHGCVIILGCYSWQKEMVMREIKRHDPNIALPLEITAEVASDQRVRLYQSMQCCFVTTKIMVVDLLCGRVGASSIAGIIVVNAHRVTESSGEAFAVRLYHEGRAKAAAAIGASKASSAPLPSIHPPGHGFVRALTDDPTGFASGFNKVEKAMKALGVKKLSLWPRFQQYVVDELDVVPPEVVEWEQELTPAMMHIQASIVEMMDKLIKELRRTNCIDCSEIKLENGISRAFDRIIRRQLDAVWNTVSSKAKQICRDLSTLRQIALHLLRHDSVTFLAYIEGLRLSEGIGCLWIMQDAAHVMYEMARRRVYVYKRSLPGPSSSSAAPDAKSEALGQNASTSNADGSSGGASELQLVLEQVPKWSLLRQVLTEIQGKRKEWLETSFSSSASSKDLSYPVLVVSRQPHMSTQLQQVLSLGGTHVMEAMYQAFILNAPPPDIIRGRGQREGTGGGRGGEAPHEGGRVSGGQWRGRRGGGRGGYGGRSSGSSRGGGAMMSKVLGPTAHKPGEEFALSKEAERLRERGEGRGGRGGVKRKPKHRDDSPPPPFPRAQEEPPVVADEQPKVNIGSGGGGAAIPFFGQGTKKGYGKDKAVAGGGGRKGGSKSSVETSRRGREHFDEDYDEEEKEGEGEGEGREAHASRGAGAGTRPSCADRDAAPFSTLDQVSFYSLDDNQDDILWQVKPSFVVLYELDLSFIRQLEVYHAERVAAAAAARKAQHEAGDQTMTQQEEEEEEEEEGVVGSKSLPKLVVHHLTYAAKDSLEGQGHLSNVEREKRAMVSLIDFKQHMVLQQGMPHGTTLPSWTPEEETTADVYQRNQLTRRAGGGGGGGGGGGMAGSGSTCPTVVVDMREFGSQLPSVLHKKGVRLVPVTLEVGDYILSPEICVERKSIPDLHQSLSSGRLYAQAESMCKHYKTACLLIEFDPDKSFALVSQRDLLDDISSKSILSRLCLLILHFPRLRLLWSRGPHSTADLFLSLKSKNQEEPDPGVAALVGLHNALGAGGGGGAGVTSNAAGAGSLFLSAAASREWLVNEPAQALLRRMPGVTEGNVRGLMSELGSLRGVADASLEDLQRIMGGGRNAQILFDFLHTR